MKLVLSLLFSFTILNAAPQFTGAQHEGKWLGTIEAGAAKLRVAITLTKSSNGKWGGSLDSLDQGAMGLPISNVKVEGQRVTLEVPSVRGTYDAKLSADGKDLDGTWTQGSPLPLKMRRIDSLPAAKRPQNPVSPFPYDQVEVTVEIKPADVKLAGTLTLPRGTGPFPAVLLLTGSGPQDRDETLMEHKPFLVIADHLSRNGFAVLRLDDRGVGKSTGSLCTSTMQDMAADAQAAVEFLKSRPKIDGKRIGLIGHSEGGVVAPIAANRSTDLAFVVLLAGTAVTGEQIIYEQGRLMGKAMGATDDNLRTAREMQEKLFQAVRDEKDPEKLKARLGDNPAVQSQLAMLSSPNFRSLLEHDPAVELRKLKVPVLAMSGANDMQVPPLQNLGPMASALAAAGNADISINVLPKLNHLFQTSATGLPSEYATIEETFAPSALDAITDWLKRHTR